MWRTSEWWQALDKHERNELKELERLSGLSTRSKHCGYCFKPINRGPLCLGCMRRMVELQNKGAAGVKRAHERVFQEWDRFDDALAQAVGE
jgi:hypothetical protein